MGIFGKFDIALLAIVIALVIASGVLIGLHHVLFPLIGHLLEDDAGYGRLTLTIFLTPVWFIVAFFTCRLIYRVIMKMIKARQP